MRAFLDCLTRILAASALFFAAGCSRNESPPAQPQSFAVENNAQISESYEETLPRVDGSQGYIGSESCRECHKDQYTSWHRTYHRTMTQVASRESIQADFNDVILTNENNRFTLYKSGDEYWVRMEEISAQGGAAAPLHTRVGLVTGSHHMQVFWVPEGHGNLQIGFPFTWLIPEKRWVPRNSTFIRPPGMDHRPEAWNIVCSRCHTTGVQPHFEAATRSVSTQVGELGISCEACHGPGQRHFDLRTVSTQPRESTVLEANEIVHPEELAPRRASQVCGFCHSMKWIDHAENWRDSGFTFRPGDDLEKTTPIIRKATFSSIPGLSDYLAQNPNLMSDFFWNDGMVRVSGREYNGLLDSPCYKDEKFSCLSCHSMHKSEPNDLLAEKGIGNRACTQCHEKYRSPEAITAHTRHSLNSSGSECYNCHMPHTTYGVLKAIRSHQVSSPRVQHDLETRRPNACNLCHLDRSLAWTAKSLSEWYRQPSPALPNIATNTSYALRLALSGDAGQRALVAWHLGWQPAQQASGTNWLAPVLGQLLDDPYAAVRLVAERSMRSLNLLPPNYDYTIPPENRAPARNSVWEQWQTISNSDAASVKQEAQVLAWPRDLEQQKRAYDELLGWRDHRPVRLRE